jgi:hypothetical protein
MLRNVVRAGLVCLAALCVLPAAGCSSASWCHPTWCTNAHDRSKGGGCCFGVCNGNNKVYYPDYAVIPVTQ